MVDVTQSSADWAPTLVEGRAGDAATIDTRTATITSSRRHVEGTPALVGGKAC